MHKGIYKGFDPKTNTCYSEKSIPIKLSYTLTILATNTADIDEIVREILFKYTSMYYLKAKVPYEVDDREIRFGIVIDPSSTLSKESSNADYLKEGKLYQSRIKLNCEGAVLISYTGKHMTNFMLDPEINVE